jgi:hypothetical protein
MPVVMTYDDATIRYRLRLVRTDIQVRAPSKGYRRQTLWAALQQFEELLDAAGTVGPASRPLPLFYALSQAGRAITAAHGSVPWELSSHGLEMPGPSKPTPLLERTIEPKRARNDSFHRVAETIGSGVLTAPVELGALWASLPYDLPKAWAKKWPTALRLSVQPGGSIRAASQDFTAELEGYLFEKLETSEVQKLLDHYPTVQGWYFPGGDPQKAVGRKREEGWNALLSWTIDGNSQANRAAALAKIAPEYRRRGDRWIRPSVGPNKDYLKPLTAWWVLLFGLSIVARYEPAEWAKALAINQSDLAANLESLLDDAMLAVPQLVLEALEGQPFLVSR